MERLATPTLLLCNPALASFITELEFIAGA